AALIGLRQQRRASDLCRDDALSGCPCLARSALDERRQVNTGERQPKSATVNAHSVAQLAGDLVELVYRLGQQRSRLWARRPPALDGSRHHLRIEFEARQWILDLVRDGREHVSHLAEVVSLTSAPRLAVRQTWRRLRLMCAAALGRITRHHELAP